MPVPGISGIKLCSAASDLHALSAHIDLYTSR